MAFDGKRMIFGQFFVLVEQLSSLRSGRSPTLNNGSDELHSEARNVLRQGRPAVARSAEGQRIFYVIPAKAGIHYYLKTRYALKDGFQPSLE